MTGLAAPLDGWNATLNGPEQRAGNHSFGGITTGHSPGHVEHPARERVPAVRERAGRRLGDHGRQAVRSAHGQSVHVLPEHQPGVQAPAEDDRPDGLVAGQQPANLSFFTSYNTEQDWDYVFVEAQTLRATAPATATGTRCPTPNGHTSDDTGASCPAGWSEELHNHLRHYTTFDPNANGAAGGCIADRHHRRRGTPRAATPAAGRSGTIDLSRLRGQAVEISIVYATDWGTLPTPGMLVDDTKVTVQRRGHATRRPSRRTLGGWDDSGRASGGPVLEPQRLDPVAADLRGRGGHEDPLRPGLRIRARGRGRGGEPRRPDEREPSTTSCG